MKSVLCAAALATTAGISTASATTPITLAPAEYSGFIHAVAPGITNSTQTEFGARAQGYNLSGSGASATLTMQTTPVLSALAVTNPNTTERDAQASGTLSYSFEAVNLRNSNSQNAYKIQVDATISESFQGANTQYVLLAGASFAITSASGVLEKIGEDDSRNRPDCFGQLASVVGDCTVVTASSNETILDQDFTIMTNTPYLVTFKADAESIFLKSTPSNEDLTAFAQVDPIISSVTSDPDVVLLFSDGVGNGAGSGAGLPASPELSTWAMLALGFAGLSFVGYRRKSQSALAAA
jgi:hypothetical protein